MTEQRDPGRTTRDSFASGHRDSEEVVIRQGGRDFLLAFYAALKNLRLYPVENVQVQTSLDDVHAHAASLLEMDPEMEVRLSGEFIFVNSTRLRIGLDNYSSFSHILSTLGQCGVGSVFVVQEVERREWQVFLSLILAGYAFGIAYKLMKQPDAVTWLYVMNSAMILTEIILYFRYKKPSNRAPDTNVLDNFCPSACLRS